MGVTLRLSSAFLVLSGYLLGQTSSSDFAFEVASVKLVESPSVFAPTTRVRDLGRLVYKPTQLGPLVCWAYALQPYQVIWPKGWESAFYDIEATIPPDTPKTAVPFMMRRLIEERFKLRAHRETRLLPVYAVTVAKAGSRLTPAPGSAGEDVSEKQPFAVYVTARERHIKGEMTLATLLGNLQHQVDFPMVDLTNLESRYHIDLAWPVIGLQGSSYLPSLDSQTTPIASSPGDGLSFLFAAMERQLGLKVEFRKMPIETFVIDHVERIPIEN
jgi:uncharacterized protein (TIGR03435 family)